jgi:hypothetical protein
MTGDTAADAAADADDDDDDEEEEEEEGSSFFAAFFTSPRKAIGILCVIGKARGVNTGGCFKDSRTGEDENGKALARKREAS